MVITAEKYSGQLHCFIKDQNGIYGTDAGCMDLSGFADSETFYYPQWGPYQQLIYSTMIFPITVYASAQREVTVEVTRNTSGPGIYLSRPVALPGACSWLVTQ